MPSLGSAKFMSGWRGDAAAEVLPSGQGFFMGEVVDGETGAGQPGILAFSPRRHFLSIASTRSGKGQTLIIPNLLQYGGSAIVIDPKGENAWVTAPYRRAIGKAFILDPWDEVNRRYGDLAGQKEQVARFNPFSILDPASPHYADDVAYLADAVIVNQSRDAHFDDSARELVGGLMAYIAEMPALREKASFAVLRQLLTAPPEMLVKAAQQAMQELGPDSVAARKLGRFSTMTRETASIISTALTQTAFLDSSALAANMATSDFSFDDLVNGTATIYLVLPVDKLQTYGRWLRLMVSIAIRTVARNEKPLDKPVAFFLDEFGTIGALRAVSQAYGLMAGLNMALWVFVQDLVQLKRDYPEDWETFVGNSEAVTSFGVMDQFTLKYLSDMLGHTMIERISVATAEQRKAWLGDPNYTKMADQQFSVPLARPEDIRGMNAKRGIAYRRGDPVLFNQMAYNETDFFLVRARPDPRYPGSGAAQRAALARNEEKLVALKVPTVEAAKALIEREGYQAKRAMLSGKWEVRGPNGETQSFDGDRALLAWVRERARS
jgi:type IV secretion system protein VirD4